MKKITFKKLIFSNFKYQNNFNKPTIFKIENKLTAGKNGIGKTSILDAISFLFTNLLSNGSAQGWENLNQENTPSGLKPYIKIEAESDNQNLTFELKDGKRSVNNIFFTLKEFKEKFFKEKFLIYSVPNFILEKIDTNEKRELFLSLLTFENIKKEVEKTVQISPKVWEKLELSTNSTSLLSSVKKQLSEVNAKFSSLMDIKTKEFLKSDFNPKTDLDKIKKLSDLIFNYEKFDSFLKNDTCHSCGQKLIKDLEKEKTAQEFINKFVLIDLKAELSTLLNEQFKYENNKKIDKDLDHEIELTTTQLNDLSAELDELNKFLEARSLSLNKLLNKNFKNFKLKLFHKTKTGTINEVFTITDEKGVDYKFLNRAKKLIIGIELALFFQQKDGVDLPLLIDDLEILDNHELLKDLNFIGFYVA